MTRTLEQQREDVFLAIAQLKENVHSSMHKISTEHEELGGLCTLMEKENVAEKFEVLAPETVTKAKEYRQQYEQLAQDFDVYAHELHPLEQMLQGSRDAAQVRAYLRFFEEKKDKFNTLVRRYEGVSSDNKGWHGSLISQWGWKIPMHPLTPLQEFLEKVEEAASEDSAEGA